MDRTIGTLLVLCVVFLLISLGQARTITKLEKQIEATKEYIGSSCTCRGLK